MADLDYIQNVVAAMQDQVGDLEARVSSFEANANRLDTEQRFDERVFEELNHAFRAVRTSPDGYAKVSLTAGRRCAYGSANHNTWETVAASGPFDYVSGHSVYMTWTNTTSDTPGAWSDVLYGLLPAQTDSIQVIEIVTITDGEEPVYGNVGNIKVYDVGECE